ncbi:MAG TPA: serine/threonine-protein kinase [Polyangia bacterium]|nr:serine/threonine-protein kinase [Polyangia bacterium]
MKYRLTEKIGSGGMAEVFRAVGEGPEGFERPFVIKRIHPRLSESPEFVRMFVDEAKISARLVHPNIVQVFDFAPQDGGYYIVMEPVEGFDMGWLLRGRLESRHEVPPPAFVAEVGRQACRGLDFAHTLAGPDGKPLGIVHRDVTPPNIMVTWTGTVKVVDFGIARAVEALRRSVTDAGMVKGKMSYIAPELLDGKTATARSDVFSLGVVLHELLSGRQLFAGLHDLDTLRLVREMEIPPPSARNPGVKRTLDAVVMRALERDPDKRFTSAGEMGDALETIVMRERYSTRALARKARELADHHVPGQSSATGPIVEETIEVVDSGSLLLSQSGSVAVPAPVARTGSTPIVDEVARKHRPTPPPRVPATASAPAPTAAAAPARAPRWAWIALGLPSALAVVLLLLLARPPIAPALPPPAPSPTVRAMIDSAPQGATVAAANAAAAGLAAGALGETPLMLELPRGRAPIELLLTKTGYTPLVFKVLPHQDREVLAHLEPLPPSPPPVAIAPAASLRPVRSRRSQMGLSTVRPPGAVVAPARAGAPALVPAGGRPATGSAPLLRR